MSLTKNKHRRLFLVFIAGIILFHSLAVLFSSIPVQAASGVTYKWNKTDGTKIDVSGGGLTGTESVKVATKPSDKLSGTSVSRVVFRGTATYKTGMWWWESTQTESCYVPVVLTFTSESSGTATIDNNYQVAGVEGQSETPCSAPLFQDGGGPAVVSLFDNVSFVIGGTRVGGGDSPETDDQKHVTIVVYPAGPASESQAPADLQIVVTGAASKGYAVSRSTYTSDNVDYYQYRTDPLWDPGSYTVCLQSNPSLNFPCQNVTKEKFKSLSIIFGNYVAPGENPDYRVVQTRVEISGTYRLCRAWRLDPLTLEMKNEDGTVAKTVQTDEFNNIVTDNCTFSDDIYATGTKYINGGNFTDVSPGDYTICIKDTEICTSFTKKEDYIAIVTLDVSGQAGQDLLDTAYEPDKRQATTNCSVVGIGWLVCPVVTFLSKLADGLFNTLADTFLRVNVSLLNQNSSAGPTTVFDGWKAMQGIANVVLIIVFLIIIFSQVSNIGLSSYGLKKLAPKLVIAAILINLSFIICSLGVDISNTLGYSIRDFFDGLAKDAVAGSTVAVAQGAGAVTDQSTQWASLSGGILAIVGASVAGYFMLSMLGSLLIAALIALLVILLILVGRQAIIILAIILAPVAIAMWLLPNTEKIAKQWSKIFISMLTVFPIIALLFGACTFVSVVMTYSFNKIEGVDGTSNNFLGQIVAAGVQVIPLIATPFILQGILVSVPVIGAFASRMAQRANGNLGSKASDGYNRSTFATARRSRLEGRNLWQQQRVAERIAKGKGMTGLFTKGLGITKGQQYANRSVARSAISEAEEATEKDIRAEQSAIVSQRIPMRDKSGKDMVHELHQAVSSGDTVRARALQNIMIKTESGREAYYEAMERIESDSAMSGKNKEEGYNAMRENIKHNFQGIRSTDAALETFSNAPSGSLKDAQTQTSTSGEFDNLTDAELANQHVENVKKATGLANDPERARRMLKNPSLSGMSEKVRGYLEGLVSNTPDV